MFLLTIFKLIYNNWILIEFEVIWMWMLFFSLPIHPDLRFSVYTLACFWLVAIEFKDFLF